MDLNGTRGQKCREMIIVVRIKVQLHNDNCGIKDRNFNL